MTERKIVVRGEAAIALEALVDMCRDALKDNDAGRATHMVWTMAHKLAELCGKPEPEGQLPCAIGDCNGPAVAIAPQLAMSRGFVFKHERFIYVPVCADHLDGWWDDSEDEPHPPIFNLADFKP